MVNSPLIKALNQRIKELKTTDKKYAKLLANKEFTKILSEQSLIDGRNYCIELINKYHAIKADLNREQSFKDKEGT